MSTPTLMTMPRRCQPLAVCLLALASTITVHAASDLADAINQLGLDLLRAQTHEAPAANHLLSPYSIQLALAMAYAGADGVTRDEMQRVLHLRGDATQTAHDFRELSQALINLQAESRQAAEAAGKQGARQDAIELNVANRLFVNRGFELRPDFTNLLRDVFKAPLRELDFLRAAEPGRDEINLWIAEETHDRIREVIPQGAINESTRVVLANAIHLKAPWAQPFATHSTRPQPFWSATGASSDVPMMSQREDFGYDRRTDHVALTLPYTGGDLQLLVLLPDARDGLDALERSLTSKHLAACAKLKKHDVIVHLPKLKLEPPILRLGETLRTLGMNSAFDRLLGSANFDRMATRKPDDYLAISEVAHRTWLELDEEGTEAAAATAVVMVTLGIPAKRPPPPIEVRIDHPFLFAIQHVPSGACLFLGRVVDPR